MRRLAEAVSTPLAPGQETIWEFMRALSPADPGASRVTVLDVRDVTGALDIDRLRTAGALMTRRHEALRLVFVDTGARPRMRVLPQLSAPVTFTDVARLSEPTRGRAVGALLGRERTRTFDLRNGPLWHVAAVRTAPNRHLVTACFSHVIADFWAADLFMNDLLRVYSASPRERTELARPEVPLTDILALQQSALPAVPERTRYWADRLTPLPTAPAFPVSEAPEEVDLSHQTARRFRFPTEVRDGVGRTAWQLRTTPFVALLAAYQVLLATRTGWNRIVLGTTTLGRERAPARRAFSQFTNNVYLVGSVTLELPLRQVVKNADAELSAAIRNVSSFHQIATAVHPHRDTAKPWPFLNLYHSWFQSSGPDRPEPEVAGLRITRCLGSDAAGAASHTPVTTATHPGSHQHWVKAGTPHIVLDHDRGGGQLIYHPAFFSDELITGVLAGYQSIVAALSRDPDRRVGDLSAAAGRWMVNPANGAVA